MTQDNEIPTEDPTASGGMKTAKSLVLVNTGDGKGKSTAAFGTILRALARDWPVAVVQYLKSGDWNVGEEKMLRGLGVEWFTAGDGFTWNSDDLDESKALAQGAWAKSMELIAAGKHRLVVFDEISYAMTWDWIDTAEVVATIENRPENVSIILTGRDMKQEVIDVAHTVTSMTQVKHAFEQKIVAKKGIDY
ncbi:MAG: cob(I)alamin adenosyltransferase [Acidimicrobiales bacterium]|jgi:cob(I)alamin adenosyltransferase